MKFLRCLPLLLLLLVASSSRAPAAAARRAKGRIFILMVWDGLRPDFVNQRDTPNLFALEHEGVNFAAHHAVFPSVTMVNAAALATGYPPGGSGIFGDSFYMPPSLRGLDLKSLPGWNNLAINLEHTDSLIKLNQPALLDGHLVDAIAIGRRVSLAHGYVVVAGKAGPTFLFDSSQFTQSAVRPARGAGSLLIADDVKLAPGLAAQLGSVPDKLAGDVMFGARDVWYTDGILDVLPAAIAASDRGRPALLVLWERNPDCTQHRAGLGTEVALEALTRDDQNLGRLRAAIASRRIGDRADLMVVSDHGFVTIGTGLKVPDILVGAGLKLSHDSDDVVAVGDQGSELIYLSPTAFPSVAARQARLQKIVDFAAAQDWCGPIFSRAPESFRMARDGRGWIAGTFDERVLGLDDRRRAPDLIISMRENSDQTNLTLTGPDRPATFIDARGLQPGRNRSQALVRPVMGTMDGDVSGEFATGMGAHGAIGRRELHNFCAAVGPDFRRHFIDNLPTANTDVAPTIAHILALRPVRPAPTASVSGRVMSEALLRSNHRHAQAVPVMLDTRLDLAPLEVETRLLFTSFDGHRYLDDARVERIAPRAPGAVSEASAPSR